MPEVIETKPTHRFALIHLEPIRHEGAETVRSRLGSSLFQIKRSKPEVRYLPERPSAQEAAGLEIAQPALVARAQQERTVKVMRLPGDFVGCGLIAAMGGDEGEEVAGDLRPAAVPHRGDGRARPLAEALLQKRQIEQPFTGVVDDFHGHLCWTAGDLAEQLPNRIGGREADFETDLADVDRAIWPVGNAAGHLFDIPEIRKSREPVRLAALEVCGDQPAVADHAEERHPVRIVDRAEEIKDQAGDEDGLTGAAEARHREPDRRASRKLTEIAGQTLRRLHKNGREPAQVDHGCHYITTAAIAPEMGLTATPRKCPLAAGTLDGRLRAGRRNVASCSIAAISNRCFLPPLSPR